MAQVAFYVGVMLGGLAVAAFTTWVVADCQSKASVCVVTLEVNDDGVLHFTPLTDSPLSNDQTPAKMVKSE